ncbi:putative amidohydrolase [Nonomuraea africana]|uniref:Amidohydrolase n=1 Tax=Nonomuraea africana TaxID=46171 RepID=A0ABR9KCT5_9ACTN|nr:putative amidohydrolase [Nonomuraea africana]
MIISPQGEVLAETVSTGPEVLKITIEVNQTSNWYLGQRRDLSRL